MWPGLRGRATLRNRQVHVPVGSDELQRRLLRSVDRREELRRVRPYLRLLDGVLQRRVRLRRRDERVQQPMRRRPDRSDELRRVRQTLQPRPNLPQRHLQQLREQRSLRRAGSQSCPSDSISASSASHSFMRRSMFRVSSFSSRVTAASCSLLVRSKKPGSA